MKIIDLFSGVGGLSQGFEWNGFENSCVSEEFTVACAASRKLFLVFLTKVPKWGKPCQKSKWNYSLHFITQKLATTQVIIVLVGM